MTDDLPWDYPSPATPSGATGKRCRRHEWYANACRRCGVVQNPVLVRRGRTNLRAGKDAERAVAKAYGPRARRTGQYGGPDDVIVGELFIVQSKAGAGWYRQAIVDELDKLPRSGGRIPTLVVSSRLGPGHPARRYVVRLLEDDVALHGDKP